MSATGEVSLINRPRRGTWAYRRNCSVRLEDGALVVRDRHKREERFPLDGSEQAPVAHLSHFGGPEPNVAYYVDGNGAALIKVAESHRWNSEIEFAIAKAAGLRIDATNREHPLRPDGIVLEDAEWAEPKYVFGALAVAQGLFALARLGALEIMPWLVIILVLDLYAAVALFSGRYAHSNKKANG